MFLNADGAELQRIRGYQTSEQFLKAAGEVAANPEKDAVTRAREELETGYWPEAMARQKLAFALRAVGKQEEALVEYMAALDSLGTDMMSRNYWVHLIRDVCDMAGDYPPAGEKMRTLREELVKRVETGKADRYDLNQITTIDSGLNQREKTLELYSRLKEKGDVPAELMSGFARSCRDLLLEDRQYAALEAESYGGLLFRTLADINSLNRQKAWGNGDFSGLSADRAEMMKKRFESMSDEQRAKVNADMMEHLVGNIGEQYQIALGVDKTGDAATIAEKVLEAYPSALTYHTLAVNALRSGNPHEVDLEYAGKAVGLDRGEHPDYVQTRYELMQYFERVRETSPDSAPAEAPPVAGVGEDH